MSDRRISLMSKKARADENLIGKAERVFTASGGRSIIAGQGLSRSELRALERAGMVRKMITFGKQKYSGITGAIVYRWQWIDRI